MIAMTFFFVFCHALSILHPITIEDKKMANLKRFYQRVGNHFGASIKGRVGGDAIELLQVVIIPLLSELLFHYKNLSATV